MKKELYQLSIDETISELKTNKMTGLNDLEVTSKREEFGVNELLKPKKKSLLKKFIEQMTDFMVLVLLAAAIFSIATGISDGHYAEGLLILAIVILNALLGIFQEAKAEKALDSIKAMSSPHAKVLRNGKEMVVEASEVVVGDIVLLDAGDYVPADIRIIESHNLKIDESALTGEAVPVEKNIKALEKSEIPLGDRINLGFMSTVVTYGRGRGVVTAVGMSTEIGKIATLLSETEEEKTPLQKNISQLGKILAIIALGITVLIFAITIIEEFATGKTVTLNTWKDALLTSIALAVAAIPEGLPAIITIVLALGMQNLVKEKAIMKSLPAVETLGSTSIICSDKTGTLTQNLMTITSVFINNKITKIDTIKKLDSNVLSLVNYGVLCNDTKVSIDGDTISKIGDPTEIALTDLAINLNHNVLDIIKNYPRVYELPFDSERKLMTTVHTIDGKKIAIIKGAPDVIFARTKNINVDNSVVDGNTKKFEDANIEMADNALRVLAIAYKEIDASLSDDKLTNELLENDVTLLGLVGMIDPARPEAKDAIVLCKKAGIKTIMITGDHRNTAVAIAKDLGILTKQDDLAITGAELDKMDDEEFASKLSQIKVYARVSPENKVRIVRAWRATGVVVAMTGDGVNDAPSIKQADIGIAMGITGTEVAKGAADMVLTDDNFATIVNAVAEGRSIFANIKKAIHFLLSCNIGEIITVFLGTTIGLLIFGDTVTTLTASQILWVNLVTDSLMAIALGLEKKEPDIMEYAPRDAKKSIFSDGLGVRIAWQGTLLGLLSFLAYTIGYNYPPLGATAQQSAQTMTFMVLAFSQLFHAFSVRSEKYSLFRLKPNKFLIGAFFICSALQLLTMAFPFTRNLFGIDIPSWWQWLVIFGFALTPFLIIEFIKLINYFISKNKQKKVVL